MKSAAPKSLSDALGDALDGLGISAKIKQYEVVNEWPRIVGKQIAEVARAESIHNGKLLVRVTRSAWRNELVYLKKELMAKINGAMKGEVVTDIIFR